MQLPIKPILFLSIICLLTNWAYTQTNIGHTEITKWQYGKNGAVSITYDDGNINQFKYALPIMERLKLPATFFIITGGIPGSTYHGKFIGRPVKDIISESATIPTNAENFFERCSAAGYLGYKGTITYHTKAASVYDEGQTEHAYLLMDTLYKEVRNGDFKPGYQPCDEVLQEKGSTWEDFRRDAAKGYEFASHSITHASMPALDSANIIYELEKSKAEILDKLGKKYTFSAEVPYGYENSRVMKYAYKIYPALRNRMPEPWLKEIDRASTNTPGTTDKDYIQWQRGATTKTPLSLMQSWVDTTVAKNNTWLVLVIHGVDGLGYEALPHTLLDTYFTYIKNRENKIWIATFGDVTKYMREREDTKLQSNQQSSKIQITLSNPLDKTMYNIPLTLKTYIPVNWKKASIVQGEHKQVLTPLKDKKGSYILYQVSPNSSAITLAAI
ncbi:polysaccharide deacetylase family protein [Mucilaginibacter sp. X5P1]|uniref:polysaccharide deacetylase family protein n=1 Tax=Mucilaginibacter sp. X5P1 TaxID=2723088 RepID=UPI00161B1C3D|nr:polysaccharide deacetylase family protein [Mucilaginibacter sp. X5P1]MBB6136788.1 peptidoglycan/xylan/chitin deacetylase (PgdA/CDA1 family) [Mucilaginibacter sp. X5P1]